MIEAYKKYWINYTNFSDRTNIKDYWYTVLMTFIVSFVIGLIMGIFGIEVADYGEVIRDGVIHVPKLSTGDYILSAWALINLIPNIAIDIRRLHDTNHSGWWYLVCLIPIFGWIVLLIFFLSPSVDAGNNYSKA